MSKLVLKKSKHLQGEISINGAKNSALPILAATLLTDGNCTLHSIPPLADVDNMCQLISDLGYQIERNDLSYQIMPKKLSTLKTSYETTNKLRASFLVSGPLLAKHGQVQISYPGGCPIGNRPVDLHLKGFELLGAKIEKKHGFIDIKCDELKGNKIYLDFPSVGATENLLMTASLAKGQTIIENAAVEPEIVDLTNFLNSMGAEIIGSGTDTIKINGVERLTGTVHTVIPDRIEAGTYMVAAAMTKGQVKINQIICDHLRPVSAKLREIGVEVTEDQDSILVNGDGASFKPADIKTLPYPGFPTDMQAPFASLFSLVKGTSIITETIFENRFLHMGELKRMGANIKVEGRTAVIEGTKLSGTKVKATDLRAGAALVLAGLCANGETQVEDCEHITRGYYNFEENLNALGAKVIRID